MFHLFRDLFKRQPGKISSRRRRGRPRSVASASALRIEPLEQRRLMAIDSFLIGSTGAVSEVPSQAASPQTLITTPSTYFNALASAPDGTFYAATINYSNYTNSIEHLDQAGNLLGQFALPAGVLEGPTDMILGPDGNLFVSSDGVGIQEYSPSGQLLRQMAFPGDEVTGMAIENGYLYAIDFVHNSVIKMDLALQSSGVIFSDSRLASPDAITVGPDGNLYISSYAGNAVYEFDLRTWELSEYASAGIDQARKLTFDSQGNLDVVSRLNDEILQFSGPNSNGTVVATVSDPLAIARTTVASVYVSSSSAITSVGMQSGVTSGVVGSGAEAIAAAPDGTFWAAGYSTSAVYHYDRSGNLLGEFSLPNGTQDFPNDLAVGSNGNIYVSSSALGIQEYAASAAVPGNQAVPTPVASYSPIDGENFVGLAFDKSGN
ncbi:MAG TPA: hypothetical protein VFI31_10430, partial [Pirellulales bacterium]|nr:hypothetical protein [Pirellulales bacterium]